jgi:hypothetical protein
MMAPYPRSATTTSGGNDDSEYTATTGIRWVDYALFEISDEKEMLMAKHVHPWRQEPKRLRFDRGRAVKVSPAIFDRKPFLNAYKSARSLAA